MESQGEAIHARLLAFSASGINTPYLTDYSFLSSMFPPSTYILSPFFIPCIGSLFINRSFPVFELNRFLLFPSGPWRPTSSLRP